jgi:hypothetical protein
MHGKELAVERMDARFADRGGASDDGAGGVRSSFSSGKRSRATSQGRICIGQCGYPRSFAQNMFSARAIANIDFADGTCGASALKSG